MPWEVLRDFIVPLIVIAWGYVMYTIKRNDRERQTKESTHIERTEELEKRVHHLEKNFGIIEERTKNIDTNVSRILDKMDRQDK